MDRFHAAVIANAMNTLARLGAGVALEDVSRGTFNEVELSKHFNQEFVDAFKEVKLSRLLKGQMDRTAKRLEAGNCTVTEIYTLFRELNNSIVEEFASSWFLQIPTERRPYYEQRAPIFGPDVDKVFQSATQDISAAGRCFALDEWPACVFHLMRVLEIGLRTFGTWVGLPESSLEFENWKNVIDQIEKQIRALEQTQKSATKSETLQFYSEAATNFWYFKEAWRNHVSHSRATYDEGGAVTVYNGVLTFMQTLAKHQISIGMPFNKPHSLTPWLDRNKLP